MITHEICKIGEALKKVKKWLGDNNISSPTDSIDDLFDGLKKDLYTLIEYPYVDKLYRDSYYFYFASKRLNYKKNTLRISFFKDEVDYLDFSSKNELLNLKSKFLGFLIVRPLSRCLGRNIISPKALENSGFFIRTMPTCVTIYGVKFFIQGFPHSSQDAEAMTCAETTVWGLMHYFGSKYSEYSISFPSRIRESLNLTSSQRLLPSSGLTVESISLVVKSFGLGSRIYGKKSLGNEFHEILNCYIESGLPVILGLTGKTVGHAVIAIGRKYIDKKSLLATRPKKLKNISLVDFDSAEREIVLIDDNYPPYQCALPEHPTSYYGKNTQWEDVKISSFVAPLHTKIYLEAKLAKECFFQIIDSKLIPLNQTDQNFIRVFMTSGRSYKYYISQNENLNKELKNKVMELELPKFIWVAELSSSELIDSKKAKGFIIIDATEAEVTTFNPFIFAASENSIIVRMSEDPFDLHQQEIFFEPFKMYIDNLSFFSEKKKKINNNLVPSL